MTDKQISEKIQTVSRKFQTTLNKRLDKMNFKDWTGEEYEDPDHSHPENNVYFVQRDDTTIELWKGDIQISGQGGDWVVVNALLLESSSAASVTGGADGTIFMTSGDHNDTLLDTPSYNQISGQFTLTTRGRQEGQNWVTRNAPTGDFYILYNYQVAVATSRTEPYISSDENQITRYPKYILNLIRNSVRETLTLTVFQMESHTSEMPTTTSSSLEYHYFDDYDDTYEYLRAANGPCCLFRTGLYVERVIEGGATTHGYYYGAGGYRHASSILTVNVTNIHYDSNLDLVVGTPYIFQEYTKEQSCAGQLGLRRDLTDGSSLAEPYVIFNVNHPQNYANEFIMYKILKGESIT